MPRCILSRKNAHSSAMLSSKPISPILAAVGPLANGNGGADPLGIVP